MLNPYFVIFMLKPTIPLLTTSIYDPCSFYTTQPKENTQVLQRPRPSVLSKPAVC
jgi:hypothetical protein